MPYLFRHKSVTPQGKHSLTAGCKWRREAYFERFCRAPKGCPCTPQLLCSSDERGIFNEFCDIPRAPVSTFSMHGGAGGIMSVGLMRSVSFDFMEMCVKSLYSTGTDHPCHKLTSKSSWQTYPSCKYGLGYYFLEK